jgi:hypothetical protein
MSKLIRSLWLLSLFVFFGAQLIAVPFSAASVIRFMPDYDGQTRVSITYDGISLLGSDYDSGVMLTTDGEANTFAGTSSLFGKTAKFLAAEETTGGLVPTLQGNVPNAVKWINNGGSVSYGSGGITEKGSTHRMGHFACGWLAARASWRP